MEATAQRARTFAIDTSARWPSCRLPIVGTKPMSGSAESRSLSSEMRWMTCMERRSERGRGSRAPFGPRGAHVGGDGGRGGRGALHEVLHEARLGPGIEVEQVGQHEHLRGDVPPGDDKRESTPRNTSNMS